MAAPLRAWTPRIVIPAGSNGRAAASIISVERTDVFGLIKRMDVIEAPGGMRRS